MFLKSLDLYGFKSFADKTHIDFADGITSLLGQNGTGKSNIVDAIKWVLGEQSMKTIRAGKKEDVIFNGTDTRKPMNFAEVTLVIDQQVSCLHDYTLTMRDMAKKEILPAVEAYLASLAGTAAAKKAVDPALGCGYELRTLQKLSSLADLIDSRTEELESATVQADAIGDITEQAFTIQDAVLPAMRALRTVCDEAETLTAASYWPFPTYGDLLFGVR